jgi:hypothetical protein
MPLVPLVRAVDMNTDAQGAGAFNWSSVDIITDRNNLRKLLRWASSSSKQVFRIDTQLAGEGTVLFNRWNERDKARGGFSYGINFEKSSTSPAKGCDGTSSHHRIIKYVGFLYDARHCRLANHQQTGSRWTQDGCSLRSRCSYLNFKPEGYPQRPSKCNSWF